MATKKAVKNTNYFSFEKIGDSVSGVLNGFYSGLYGLVCDIGGKKVTVNKTQLLKIFRDNRNELKAGKKLTIKLVDEKKVKGQRHKVKIFSVNYNGKELKSAQDFELKKDLSAKEFDLLFEADKNSRK